MRNRLLKLASVMLILVITLTSLTTTVFAQTNVTCYTFEVEDIKNPLYEDYSTDEISAFSLTPKRYYSKGENFDTNLCISDYDSIAEDLREVMVERGASIDIYYKDTVALDGDTLHNILIQWRDLALCETENAYEGDYLRYVWSGITPDTVTYISRGTYYYYHIPLNITYYTTKAQEEEFDAELEKVIDGFGFTETSTSRYKCDKIYDYITSNVSYDYDNLNDESYELKYTAYAALINKTAVCQGYATLYYRMARECGLETRVIAGKSYGQNHAWNIVKLGSYYYFLDSTWDAGKKKYRYYLKGSKDFEDHTLGEEFSTAQFSQKYPISDENYDSSDISKMEIVLSYHTSVYDGKPKKPEVTIEGLNESTDFTVEYTNNVNVGTATVTVTAIGKYKGTAVVTFEICPQATSSVTAKLLGITQVNISWQKVAGADGYNIYRKTTGDYTLIGSTAGLSYSIANLADNAKYTFKVVAYYFNGKTKKESVQYKTATVTTLRNLSAPSKVTLSLYGYDDVNVSWSKVSYAKGYYVYYKKSSAKSYTYAGKTTSTSFKKANLSDGAKYTFKVVPYGLSGNTVILDDSYKTASVYTLKKLSTPKISKSSSSKVKVSWTNISGESGYQISQSTSKSKTKIVATYSTTSGKSKKITAKKGKTYYYKVRAYKTVNGKKIYGPWSTVKSYKLK